MHALNMNVAACVRASSVPRARRKRREEGEREGQHEYSTAPRDASSVSREEKRVQKRLVADDDAMIASFSRLSASSKKSDATRERTSIANDAIASSMDFFSTRSAAAASPSPVVLFVADTISQSRRRQSRFFCQVFVFQKRRKKILSLIHISEPTRPY